jgi:glycosyltransferase involved in cell wall biosynthesis
MARVTLVTDEILGYTRTGGIGTATTFLALALGRMGHRVEILYSSDPPKAPLGDEWARLYEAAGVAIRMLPRRDEPIAPSYFARMHDVELAVAADPPDVVIVQDLAAPAYTAIRLRTLGLAFEHTLFVVYCHGTRRWITDAARKVRVLPGALAITNLERASIELADVVVSPSAYLVDWISAQGWRLPDATQVIPHVTRAAATGEPQPRAEPSDERTRRIAFFGRLEERKGIRPFIEGVNALPAEALQDVEVEFIGRPTRAWSPDRVRSLLEKRTNVSFATDLDQPEALALLARPGTVAVMPSFEETFGNTVRECLDYGIPFIASTAAAIRELVAREDQERVLFEPSAAGIARALGRVLERKDGWRPARAAFGAAAAVEDWARLVNIRAQPPPYAETAPAEVDVVVAAPHAKTEALVKGSAPFVLLLEESDKPQERLLATLVRAQQVSGADVVTCGLRVRANGTTHFFHGDPGGLGLLANHYGTVALVRRSLLDDLTTEWPVEGDAAWPLLTRLAARGANIVSVPAVLVERAAPPGTLERHPSDALLVAQELERALPEPVRGLARLTAGLAADAAAQRAHRRAVAPAQTRAAAHAHRVLAAAIDTARTHGVWRRRHSAS